VRRRREAPRSGRLAPTQGYTRPVLSWANVCCVRATSLGTTSPDTGTHDRPEWGTRLQPMQPDLQQEDGAQPNTAKPPRPGGAGHCGSNHAAAQDIRRGGYKAAYLAKLRGGRFAVLPTSPRAIPVAPSHRGAAAIDGQRGAVHEARRFANQKYDGRGDLGGVGNATGRARRFVDRVRMKSRILPDRTNRAPVTRNANTSTTATWTRLPTRAKLIGLALRRAH